MKLLPKIVAKAAVAVLLSMTLLIALGSHFVRKAFGGKIRMRPFGRQVMALTGTFYNDNWCRAHAVPLANCKAFAQTLVVVDRPMAALAGVQYISPPRWMRWILGRTPARLLTFWTCCAKHRPDFVMGYHIMPNALAALIGASLFSGRSIFQLTGAPLQFVGGGWRSENPLLRRIGARSHLLERLMFGVIRRFDVTAVRGENAAAFMRDRGLNASPFIVTGAVDADRFRSQQIEKEYDLIMVARHIPEKRPELFVRIVAEAAKLHPTIRAAMAGDGPLTESLKEQARQTGAPVQFLGKVAEIDRVLAKSRIFVLTSSTEGLSIAMIEAMGMGLPAAAPPVGELGDLLLPGKTGIFINPEDAAESAQKICDLIFDATAFHRMAQEASSRVHRRHSVQAIAMRWDELSRSFSEGGAVKADAAQGGRRNSHSCATESDVEFVAAK